MGRTAMVVFSPPNPPIAFEMEIPRMMPSTPPTMPMTIDSIMNCMSTFDEVAPSALRMPISRVRSVTETIMMFMMPMPPTSSEMPAIEPRRSVSIFVFSVKLSMRLVMLRTLKSSSAPVRM